MRDANSSEDEEDPSHRPLETELVQDYHKNHHKVLSEYLGRVYDRIKPLLPDLPDDKKVAKAIIKKMGFRNREEYQKAAQKAAQAAATDMRTIVEYQNMLIEYNKKKQLPADLGQIPRVQMYKIWGDYKSDKCTHEQATRQLCALWARTQFPLGFTKLPPVAKGKYPTREDMEQEYRERTNCDPATGRPLGKGKSKATTTEEEKPSKGKGKATTIEEEKPSKGKGKATTTEEEKPSKGKGKARTKSTPVERGGPSNSRSAKGGTSPQEDVDMPDAPPLGDPSSGDSSESSSSGDSSSGDSSSGDPSSGDSSPESSSSEELSDSPPLTRSRRRHSRSEGRYGGSSSAVVRRGSGDPLSSAIVLRSHPSSSNYLQPGFTASNERIMAYKITTKNYHADDGHNASVTTRRYVVKKGRHTYALEWESSCGGPRVWRLLPDGIPEVNARLETMPGRDVFERGQYGIKWVAPGVMPRGGDLPAKLPDMVCKFWWTAGRGHRKHSRILFRSNLIQSAGKQWTDHEILRVLCPPNVSPRPTTLWGVLRLFYPHVQPLVASEQRRLLRAPPPQLLLAPAARRPRAITNSATDSYSDVDDAALALQRLSFNSDSSDSETDTMSRKRPVKVRSKQKHRRRSRRKEIPYETATSSTETESEVDHRRYLQDRHRRVHGRHSRHPTRSRGNRKNVRFQADLESEEPIRRRKSSKTRKAQPYDALTSVAKGRASKQKHKGRGAKHKAKEASSSSESESEEEVTKVRASKQKHKGRGAKHKTKEASSSSESESEEEVAKVRASKQKHKGQGAKHKAKEASSSSESESEEEVAKVRASKQKHKGQGAKHKAKEASSSSEPESEEEVAKVRASKQKHKSESKEVAKVQKHKGRGAKHKTKEASSSSESESEEEVAKVRASKQKHKGRGAKHKAKEASSSSESESEEEDAKDRAKDRASKQKHKRSQTPSKRR